MFMGFILHIYIIFGTNLQTEGPAQIAAFLPILEFHWKGISNGVQTKWNLREHDFLNKRDPGDLEWVSRNNGGSHEAGRCAYPPGRALHPRGPSVAPPTYFFLLYISTYPQTSRSTMET